MATVITIEGMDAAANSVGFAPPVADGLVGWWHLGSSASASERNRASGGSDAVVDGTPTYSTGYASFATQNDRLRSALLDTDAITLLAVAKSGAAFSSNSTRPNFLGTYATQSGGIAGAALQVSATPSSAPAATVGIAASRDASGVPTMNAATLTVANFSHWTFLAGIVQSGAVANGRKIIDKTNGTTGVATPATARLRNTASGNSGKISIGGFSSLLYGAVDVAWAAVYAAALTDTQVDTIYAFVQRRLLDKFSITV